MGGRTLFDFTRHTGFTLLLLAADDASVPSREALIRPLTQRYRGLLEAHVVPPTPSLSKQYGTDSRDRLFLLRPDGYVGFRSLASEADQLEAYLARTLIV